MAEVEEVEEVDEVEEEEEEGRLVSKQQATNFSMCTIFSISNHRTHICCEIYLSSNKFLS